MKKNLWMIKKWNAFVARFRKELDGRKVLSSLILGIFIYLLVNYLFAASEFYRISIWSVKKSAVLFAIFTLNIPWILSVFSSVIVDSWFKQIVYQGIAGGITGSFVKEEVKSSIVICVTTIPFYIVLALLSNVSNIAMIFLFLIKGLLIGVTGGIIGVYFYKEISEEHVDYNKSLKK